MRSDLLSKRLFAAGCLGLPWLWTVHAMYHRKDGSGEQQENNEGLLNPDDHFQDDSENGLTADEIKAEVQKWVFRCKIGALLGWMLFIAWIVVAQIYRGDVFPNSMYMLSSDSAELTGW